MTTLFFSLLIGQKQWREKKEERGLQHHVSMREKVVHKLSKSGCQNIISHFLISICGQTKFGVTLWCHSFGVIGAIACISTTHTHVTHTSPHTFTHINGQNFPNGTNGTHTMSWKYFPQICTLGKQNNRLRHWVGRWFSFATNLYREGPLPYL
jgi:hypothetical protein